MLCAEPHVVERCEDPYRFNPTRCHDFRLKMQRSGLEAQTEHRAITGNYYIR